MWLPGFVSLWAIGVFQVLSQGVIPLSAMAQEEAGEAVKPAREGFVRVLALEQEASGVPGQDPDRKLYQKMLIDSENRRLILILYRNGTQDPKEPPSEREVDRRIILHLNSDPPEVVELWDRDRTYYRTLQDLNKIQDERDRDEENTLRHLNEFPPHEQKALLEQNFLRRDGKRIVEVIKMEEGRKIFGHHCLQVKVFENGRNVIDAWMTRDIAGGESFYHLYKRLGAFSRQVLDRVEELKGLPLEAEITVVTGGPAYRISARCLSVKIEEIPVTDFDIPSNYQERKKDLPLIVPCGWSECGKEVERAEPRGGKVMVENIWYYFCSKEHKQKFLDRIDKLDREKAKRQIQSK